MSDSRDDLPSFAELAADPEIAALLDFDPVPRRNLVPGGWGPEKQREKKRNAGAYKGEPSDFAALIAGKELAGFGSGEEHQE